MNYGNGEEEDGDLNVRTHVEEIGRGHGPEAKARADARRHQSESTTPTGLIEHAVRMHRELLAEARAEYDRIVASARELAKEMLEDAQAQRELQRSEQRAIAHVTGELVEAQLSHLQALKEVNDKLRQPVERAPTAAESLADALKHFATVGFPILFKGQRLLEGAEDRFNASVKGAAGGTAPSGGQSSPAADAEADFSALKLSELKPLFAELPEDFIGAFAAERSIRSFDDVTIGDVRALFAEVKRRRAAAARDGGEDPGRA
ncbi:MAG: hypothetical protein U1A78_41740 [Polyangia bacterium]